MMVRDVKEAFQGLLPYMPSYILLFTQAVSQISIRNYWGEKFADLGQS